MVLLLVVASCAYVLLLVAGALAVRRVANAIRQAGNTVAETLGGYFARDDAFETAFVDLNAQLEAAAIVNLPVPDSDEEWPVWDPKTLMLDGFVSD